MMDWLMQNGGTILVCVILVAVVGAIVWKMVRDKKAGKSSCCGNCKNCAGGCAACKGHSDNK